RRRWASQSSTGGREIGDEPCRPIDTERTAMVYKSPVCWCSPRFVYVFRFITVLGAVFALSDKGFRAKRCTDPRSKGGSFPGQRWQFSRCMGQIPGVI